MDDGFALGRHYPALHAEDVLQARGTLKIEYTMATAGANACGICSSTSRMSRRWARSRGNQAIQQVEAG